MRRERQKGTPNNLFFFLSSFFLLSSKHWAWDPMVVYARSMKRKHTSNFYLELLNGHIHKHSRSKDAKIVMCLCQSRFFVFPKFCQISIRHKRRSEKKIIERVDSSNNVSKPPKRIKSQEQKKNRTHNVRNLFVHSCSILYSLSQS